MNKPTKPFLLRINPHIRQAQYLKDLIDYRELLYFFAWRDILVRYKEAFFGIAWAVIRPLINMGIFALVFGQIAHLSSGNINYASFVLAGLLPWQLCSNAIVEGSTSILHHANLISKIYFPRIIIPTAQIAVHFADFLIGMILLFFFCFIVQPLNFTTLMGLPIFIMLALLLSEGGSLWLSALTVKFKDCRFLIPFVVQIGMFISPVGYSSSEISSQWIWLYCLNPAVGIIDGFRWSLFGFTYPHLVYSIATSAVVTLILVVTGFLYFRKMERSFVDRL
ncbi:ABC transporter permease [Neochlamydia sp. S13]|uniref:ABC transporter permease n=1 Tax=Neochlamydia sp. S13 TaxID=1353976 RepID=UPI0005A8DD8B|nr:ABC transporter permease [Neochlamydia sp. S13]